MTCQTIGNLTICRPDTSWHRKIIRCPTCQRRRRFIVMCQEWYDPIATCCACGDAWSGGWRLERPFARGWRKRAIKVAKQRWAEA